MPKSRAKAIWRTIAASGLVVTLIGMGAIGFYVSYPSNGYAPILAGHIGAVIQATLAGVATLSIGLIGWAVLLGKLGRENLAFFAGLFPFCVILIGMFLGRRDPHGAYIFFWYPVAPLFVVAVVLGVMSAFARRE